jgi:hypothetical protein
LARDQGAERLRQRARNRLLIDLAVGDPGLLFDFALDARFGGGSRKAGGRGHGRHHHRDRCCGRGSERQGNDA